MAYDTNNLRAVSRFATTGESDGYEDDPIVQAANKGKEIFDSGVTPVFTNVGNPTDPNASRGNVVNVSMNNEERIPKKPDDRSLWLADELKKFQEHYAKITFGHDPRTATAVPAEERNMELKDMQMASDYFMKNFENNMKSSKLYPFMDETGKTVYGTQADALGKSVPTKNQVDDTKTFASWTPEEKETEFKRAILSGKDYKFSNRDAQSTSDYKKEISSWINSRGLTPATIGRIQSKYKSLDMSLKNMTKQEAPMSAFVMNINEQIKKVEQLYNEVDRTGARLVDLPIRELKTKAMGSGKEANLASYLIEISNEIGKLSTGSSASIRELSDSAQKQWGKIHDPNLSFKEIMTVLNGTRDQGNMRLDTWRKSIGNVEQEMDSLLGDKPKQTQQGDERGTPQQAPLPQGGRQMPPTNVLKEGKQTTFKNGQTWTLSNGQPIRVK